MIGKKEMGGRIRVVNVSSSLTGGGSGTATKRINECLNENGFSSSLFLARPEIGSRLNRESISAGLRTVESKFRYRLSTAVASAFSRRDGLVRSLALLDSFRVNELNKVDADIILLHWTQGGFLSIKDICRIQKPIVWVLHDSWLFCGAEHHPRYDSDCRYRDGYKELEGMKRRQVFVDIDRWCWMRKESRLQNIRHVVAPSVWMQSRAEEAHLMKGKSVYRVPHPIDEHSFFREDSVYARKSLNLPLNKQLVLFGGANPWKDKNKGWDLLQEALELSCLDKEKVAIVTFGAKNESCNTISGYQHIGMPYIESESRLRALYCSGDLLVVPSRVESFGLIAAEAQMCGLPAIGFQGSGLCDVIENGQSGVLLGERNSRRLADCMSRLLGDEERLRRMGSQAIVNGKTKWGYKVVATKYREVFMRILGNGNA